MQLTGVFAVYQAQDGRQKGLGCIAVHNYRRHTFTKISAQIGIRVVVSGWKSFVLTIQIQKL